MAVLTWLVAGAAAAEIAPFQDAVLFEQAHGPVHGGDRYVLIEGGGATVQLLHVGMVVGVGQHARDHPALACHLQAAFDAEALNARFHQAP
jgi:hypothetical protein